MQVFRLMGIPDKIIAFDELPEDLVKGFELLKADGFPKAWKRWMGEMEVVTKIPSLLNPVTGERQVFDPFVEKDSYFYLVDWNIKPVEEKWKKIEEYVRQKVSSEIRLTDKLEDMAKPLAANKVDGISLEPDDVVVIPLPKETKSILKSVTEKETEPVSPLEMDKVYKCEVDGCGKEFGAKQGLRMHNMKRHAKVEITA